MHDREVEVEPGAEATSTVRVRNTGGIVDQFIVEVLGPAAAWTTVEPAQVSLFPGAEESVTVRFRPPRLPGTPAGPMVFGVKVTSREDPAGTTVEEATLQVGAFQATSAELTPRNARGLVFGGHEVAVDNRGNVPVAAAFSGSDPDGALAFRFRPPAVSVPAGRTVFAHVRVRGKGLFLSGPTRPHPFRVVVTPQREQPIPLDGSMAQVPLLAPWLRRTALAALAGLVALTLLWFFAVKPGVESTARQAVASPLASMATSLNQVKAQQPGGSTAAGAAGGAAAGGASGGASQSSGSGTGGGAQTGFARRLDQTASGRNQYTVPAGTQLAVTDVFFQNPNGEHGTVELQRDGATLLVENLDNFRDVDDHFGTPVAFAANQTMRLAVQCPSGCPAVAMFVTGYERPG